MFIKPDVRYNQVRLFSNAWRRFTDNNSHYGILYLLGKTISYKSLVQRQARDILDLQSNSVRTNSGGPAENVRYNLEEKTATKCNKIQLILTQSTVVLINVEF